MRVRLSPRALREAERQTLWWRRNSLEHPDRFERELEHTLERLRGNPMLGVVYPGRLDVAVKRLLMSGTNVHVYFAVLPDEVYVISLWGAKRRRGPKL